MPVVLLFLCIICTGCTHRTHPKSRVVTLSDSDGYVREGNETATIKVGDHQCWLNKNEITLEDVSRCARVSLQNNQLHVPSDLTLRAKKIDLGSHTQLISQGHRMQLYGHHVVVGQIETHGGDVTLCAKQASIDSIDTHVSKQTCFVPLNGTTESSVTLSRLGRTAWLTLAGTCGTLDPLVFESHLSDEGQWSLQYSEQLTPPCHIRIYFDAIAFQTFQTQYRGRVTEPAKPGGHIHIRTTQPATIKLDSRGSGVVPKCLGQGVFGSTQISQLFLNVQVPLVQLTPAKGHMPQTFNLASLKAYPSVKVDTQVQQTVRRPLTWQTGFDRRYFRGEDYVAHGGESGGSGLQKIRLYAEKAWQIVCGE